MLINIPVSMGELFDKHTILHIKLANIADTEKRKHIEKEYKLISEYVHTPVLDKNVALVQLYNDLLAINTLLWHTENDIRAKEIAQCFDGEFITLAQQVYKNNDKRADIKWHINKLCKSSIVEIKEYVSRLE